MVIVVLLVAIAGIVIATWPWVPILLGVYIAYRLARWRWRVYWAAENLRLALLRARAYEAVAHEERLERIAALEVAALAAMRRAAREQVVEGTAVEVRRP